MSYTKFVTMKKYVHGKKSLKRLGFVMELNHQQVKRYLVQNVLKMINVTSLVKMDAGTNNAMVYNKMKYVRMQMIKLVKLGQLALKEHLVIYMIAKNNSKLTVKLLAKMIINV